MCGYIKPMTNKRVSAKRPHSKLCQYIYGYLSFKNNTFDQSILFGGFISLNTGKVQFKPKLPKLNANNMAERYLIATI